MIVNLFGGGFRRTYVHCSLPLGTAGVSSSIGFSCGWGTFDVADIVITLLQQCRVHKDRAPLSAWIARHIVFDKKKGDHLPKE